MGPLEEFPGITNHDLDLFRSDFHSALALSKNEVIHTDQSKYTLDKLNDAGNERHLVILTTDW